MWRERSRELVVLVSMCDVQCFGVNCGVRLSVSTNCKHHTKLEPRATIARGSGCLRSLQVAWEPLFNFSKRVSNRN
jgi:hypothetical protein